MLAHVGDRIIVEGTHVGEQRRVGLVTAVEREDGSPPYRVHWLADGRTTLIFPGPETHIEPAAATSTGT